MTPRDDWTPAEGPPGIPASLIAVPAAGRDDLRGRRVLIGLPGVGWRGGLRADSAIVQSARTYVPVLTEHDWYRSEAERIEVFAPLVPIERVWVQIPDTGGTPSPVPSDVFSRLVSLDAPPRRDPVPVRDLPQLTGRRLVQADGRRALRDLRAVTEPYQNAEGDVCLRLCTEVDWYRWGWSGAVPATREVPIYLLWAE